METGSAFGFYPNSGGGSVFSSLAGVWPHNIIQLASLQRISAQEMVEKERGRCSTERVQDRVSAPGHQIPKIEQGAFG